MSVICSACGETIELADRCSACGEDPLLDGRYRLEAQIGRGASGITFRAKRLTDSKVVAVKELSYRAMQSFEMEKLFRREARVLQQLDHPGIPAYIDDFTVEAGKRLSLFLVQEFVDGETLEAEMARRRYTESDVLEILDELAGILVYLQEVRPAVFHRDIKPANVMRTGRGALVLIDFGSVKATTDGSVGGSTVAGTFGYMAPEQHWGRATSQTDLYALGALGLALLSRRDPSSFVGAEHRLDWRDQIEVSQPVEELLDRLLQDQVDQRPEDAGAAQRLIRRTLERLSQDRRTQERPTQQAAPPVGEKDWTVDIPRQVDTPRQQEPARLPDEQRTPSPVPEARVRVPMAAVALIIGVGVLAFILSLPPDQKDPAAVVAVSQQMEAAAGEGDEIGALESHACSSQECAPLSTPFKDRLQFGMSIDEAKVARPELGDEGLEGSRPTIMAGSYTKRPVDASGRVLDADMAVLDRRAQCRFAFFVDDGLSQIDCVIKGLSTREGVETYSQQLVQRLTSRYGLPSSATGLHRGEDVIFGAMKGSWTWRRDGASLEVSAEFNDMTANILNTGHDSSTRNLLGEMAAKVHLTHTLDAHDAVLRQATEDEAKERARQKAERDQQLRLEMEKLKELSEDDSL